MKLFLIRHGQSKGNIKSGFMSGRTDPEGLTEKGKIQVIRTSYELRKEQIDQILVSPVTRAKETALIFHHYFPDAVIKTAKWLTELHHGMLEGFYWWEKIHKISPEYRKHREDYGTPYPGGGESMQMMFERISNGMENLIKHADQNAKIVLISHQAPITALRYFLIYGGFEKLTTDKKKKKFMQYLHDVKLPNGGFVTVTCNGKILQTLDEVSHVEPVQERKGNIEFYAKGLLDVDAVEGIRKVTASNHAVYYIRNSGDHLLKILHTEDSKSVKRHVAVYQYLREHGRSAPNIVFHDSTHEFYKNDVLIQDYIEGTEQETCLHDHPQQAKNVLRYIYDELHAIHQIPTTDVQEFWTPPVTKQFQSWKPFMLYNINLTLHMAQDTVFDQKTERRIFQALGCLKDYIREGAYARVPIHGDVAPGNIILSHGKTTCKLVRIIDYEWTRIGDRLWDLAYYWGWLERNNFSVALVWRAILNEHLSKKEQKALEWFRVLFHVWTVRDMFEYEGDSIRQERGKKSKEILERES